MTIAAIERQAMIEAGIEPKERALAEARHKLAAAEANAERTPRCSSRTSRRSARPWSAADSDAAYAEALKTIAEGDAQDDIGTLYREAQRTRTPTDDMIVRRIGGLDERLAALEKEAAGLRKTAREMVRASHRGRAGARTLPHLGLRSSRTPRSATTTRSSVVLGQILEGAVRSGILWDILRGGFGTRPSARPARLRHADVSFPVPDAGRRRRRARRRMAQPGTRGGWTPPFEFPSGGGGSGGGDGGSNDSGNDGFSTGGSF